MNMLKYGLAVLWCVVFSGCVPSGADNHRYFYSLSFLDEEYVRFKVNGHTVDSMNDQVARALNVNNLIDPNGEEIELSVTMQPRANVAGNYTFGFVRIRDDGQTEILIKKTIKQPITTVYSESWRIGRK